MLTEGCLLTSLVALLCGGDPGAGCADWIPRFELVLIESERGEFYEGEAIVIEVWLVDVCPDRMSQLDFGAFAVITECAEAEPNCYLFDYGARGAVVGFMDRFDPTGACTFIAPCSSEPRVNRWGQDRVTLLLRQPPCLRSIPVPLDGRIMLGTLSARYSYAAEAGQTWRTVVGDQREGTSCLSPFESFLRRDLPSDVRIYPADSAPVEFRVRRRPFVRGDANQDGNLDVSDPVRILTCLFLGYPSLECANAADVDDSNTIEITDAVALLMFLFNGGAPPVAPFPDPSYDRTPTPVYPEETGCYAHL